MELGLQKKNQNLIENIIVVLKALYTLYNFMANSILLKELIRFLIPLKKLVFGKKKFMKN